MPHAKPLGKGLMELRIRSGRGGQEIRIFYTIAEQYRIYLLHGFIKKTQATPRRELNIARFRHAMIDKL